MPGFASLLKPQNLVSKFLKSKEPRGWLKHENLDCDFPIKIVPDNDEYESKLLLSVKFKQDSVETVDSVQHQALDVIGESVPKNEVDFYLYGYANPNTIYGCYPIPSRSVNLR